MNPIDRAGSPARSVGGGIATSIMNSAKSYLGNLGQNIRDVGTAAGTNVQIARYGGENAMQGKTLDKAGNKNFVKQAKEVAGSLIGRPGTRSDEYHNPGGYVSAKTVAASKRSEKG